MDPRFTSSRALGSLVEDVADVLVAVVSANDVGLTLSAVDRTWVIRRRVQPGSWPGEDEADAFEAGVDQLVQVQLG